MKTVFLSLGYSFLLILAIHSPTTLLANAGITSNQIHQDLDNFNDIENDYPTSYSARIKRFHKGHKGLDYFDPRFTAEVDYLPKRDFGTDEEIKSPYGFSNFQHWARLLNSSVIWQYSNDENYRKVIDKWNHINNPFWTYAITLSCPFGSFDFTGGAGNDEIDANALIAQGSVDYFNYYYSPFRRNRGSFGNSFSPNPFVFTSKNKLEDQKDVALIGVKKLPTRTPQQTVIIPQVVETPNFTKNIPISIQWNKGRGTNSNKHDSVLSKWNRGKASPGPGGYDSLISTSQTNSNTSQAPKNNYEYSTLSTGTKSNTVKTSTKTTSNQSHSLTAPKTSSSTVNNNN